MKNNTDHQNVKIHYSDETGKYQVMNDKKVLFESSTLTASVDYCIDEKLGWEVVGD